MKASISVDTREFSRVLREYAKWNTRDWADILNAKALQLAHEVLRRTPKADRKDIDAFGTVDWFPKYIAKTLYNKRKGPRPRIKGKHVYTRAEARAYATRHLNARRRSIAFIKSGWIPAIRKLTPLVKGLDRPLRTVQGARIYGVPKGDATHARPSTSPYAEIANRILRIFKIKGSVEALQGALNWVSGDMLYYIARKMGERGRKMGFDVKT